jgi:hypothetical protein
MAVASGIGGYFAASAFTAPPVSADFGLLVEPEDVLQELKLPTAEESAFIAEWNQLHAAHGDDFGAMYAAFKDTKEAFRRRAFRSALIADWSVRDPQAALAYLLKNDSSAAPQLAREWLRRDPQRAVTGLLAGGEKARGFLRPLLSEIASVAPSRLVEVIAAIGPSKNRWDQSISAAFAIFAAKDPAAARAAAESVTGESRGQALAGVAKAWAEKDGPAALAWAQAMPPGGARDAALKAVLAGWAKTDPIAALGKLDVVPPGGDEFRGASDAGAQMLREAAKKDWDATIAWLRDNPGKLGRSSLDGLQTEMTRRLGVDTEGTMRLLASDSIPGLGWVFSNAVLNDGYAQRDAIWSWLDGQPDSELIRNFRGSLLSAIAWKEPEAGLRFLDKIPDTPENASLIERGVSSLFNGGSQMEQFEKLLGQASSKLRPRLIEMGVASGALKGMGDPSIWVARLDEIPVERRASVTGALARGWAESDPQAALRWASSLSDAAGRDGAFSSIAGTWAVNDPQEAARWVDTLPAGAVRDNAARSLVGALAKSEPETAWTWALSVQSPEARSGSLRTAYIGLRKKDPAIAEQLLESANLPADMVKTLREGFKAGR